MKTFHICTIANKWEQYQAMRASFAAAGFDEARCRFSVFDNREGNIHEAYGTFNSIMQNTEEPYIIYCHQDILLDRGYGYTELLDVVHTLNQHDQNWAVLGNAGVTENHQLILQVHDPFDNENNNSIQPAQVCSLDENFLVVKTSSQLRCSSDLQGFHLYATDLCLNAAKSGQSCYVVSFYLTHLSKGRVDESFQLAKKAFQRQWSHCFKFRYIGTTCTSIFLSRNRVARFFFSSYRVTHWLSSNPVRHELVCRFSDKTYAK